MPARVIEVTEDGVKVDIKGRESYAASPIEVAPGDFVIMGMGVILEKISEEEFNQLDSICLNPEDIEN